MTTTTFTRNIGLNRGKPRLWIEGNHLVRAGLDHGSRWNLIPNADGVGFTIQNDPEGERKIAGKPGRPIIDVVGATLTSMGFKTGDVATLTYEVGSGSISVTKWTDTGFTTDRILMAA